MATIYQSCCSTRMSEGRETFQGPRPARAWRQRLAPMRAPSLEILASLNIDYMDVTRKVGSADGGQPSSARNRQGLSMNARC